MDQGKRQDGRKKRNVLHDLRTEKRVELVFRRTSCHGESAEAAIKGPPSMHSALLQSAKRETDNASKDGAKIKGKIDHCSSIKDGSKPKKVYQKT